MAQDREMQKGSASPEIQSKPLYSGQPGRWLGFRLVFFRKCWKKKGNHGKGAPERDPPPAQLVTALDAWHGSGTSPTGAMGLDPGLQ